MPNSAAPKDPSQTDVDSLRCILRILRNATSILDPKVLFGRVVFPRASWPSSAIAVNDRG